MYSVLISIAIYESPQTQQLKKNTFIMSPFLWVRNRGLASPDSLLKVSQGCSPGVCWAAFPSGGLTKEEHTSRLIQGWQNLFSCICGIGGPNSYWPPGGGCPSVLLATCSSLTCGPLHKQSQHSRSLLQSGEFSPPIC